MCRQYVLYVHVCLPDVSSRLKAILTSDLSGDTLLVEVIIYPLMGPKGIKKEQLEQSKAHHEKCHSLAMHCVQFFISEFL